MHEKLFWKVLETPSYFGQKSLLVFKVLLFILYKLSCEPDLSAKSQNQGLKSKLLFKLKQVFWLKNYENWFRGWGWIVLKRKGIFLTPFFLPGLICLTVCKASDTNNRYMWKSMHSFWYHLFVTQFALIYFTVLAVIQSKSVVLSKL